ncbi:ABC transporter permease subunit [Photobacterium japonica]|uniref:ABC transporter permease n=1 Tax=Photobacterium japonica TaxID=2910235 RepID=UPI003D0BD9BB
MIHLFYLLALLLCIAPLLPGLLGVVLPALSWLPPLGYLTPNVDAFTQLLYWPGLSTSLLLSLFTGLGSTLLALIFSYFILRRYWDTPQWHRLENTLSPMMAMPHVAFAIGFALLFAPTGWFYRLLAVTGITPSDSFTVVQDPYGIGLLIVLALKETPFLLLMSIAVLQQLQVKPLLAISASLGYSQHESWRKLILPLWLPKMRLPLWAVAAYGVSVVDIALFIGPQRPSTFAIQVWRWFNEPDLHLLPRAAAGALLLLALTLFTLLVLRGIEWCVVNGLRRWQLNGPARPSSAHVNSRLRSRLHRAVPLYSPFVAVPILVLPTLLVWSFAQRWRFPDLLPSRYSFRFWEQELEPLLTLAGHSMILALSSGIVALLLAIGCLEYRQKYHIGIPHWIIAIPLVTPQLSLLFGIQVTTYWVPGQHYGLWVVWSHLFFVFPYLYLSLEGAWRSYDVRLDQCSRSLGKTAWQTWWQVKRPQVQPAIFMGLAVGISVSLAQYLPTQMLGAGRISTLTTEAVALASGQDRRVMAIYGLLQGILPLVFFTLAVLINRWTSHYSHGQRDSAVHQRQPQSHLSSQSRP